MSLQPLNPSLNWAVNTIAEKTFPFGFHVRPDAPNTIAEIEREFRLTGQISIWPGDFTLTGFGDTETWRNFRAWHDYVHMRYGFPFGMPGEYGAATFQSFQLYRLLGRDDVAIDAVAQLWAELIGPLEAQVKGHTVPCARAFVRAQKPLWLPMAQHIAGLSCSSSVDWLGHANEAARCRAAWENDNG